MTALAQGVATKKKAQQIFDFEWKLDIKAGDAFGTVKNQQGKLNAQTGQRQGGTISYLVNFQPYFLDYDVSFTEQFYRCLR